MGAAIGYLLDPLMCRLQRRGSPRAIAAPTFVKLTMTVLVGTLVLVLPIPASEATTVLRAVPELNDDVQHTLIWQVAGLRRPDASAELEQFAARFNDILAEASVSVFGGVIAGLNPMLRAVLFWMV